MFKYISVPKDDQKVGDLTSRGKIVIMVSEEIVEHLINELGRGSETSNDMETIERNVWLREDLTEILANVRSK